jgi:hypothetical protein
MDSRNSVSNILNSPVLIEEKHGFDTSQGPRTDHKIRAACMNIRFAVGT